MSLFIVFLIWYFVIARKDPKLYDKINKKAGKIAIAFILLFAFSGQLPWLVIILFILSPLILIVVAVYSLRKRRQEREYRERTKPEREMLHAEDKILVKAVPKRRKIVEKFNTKYKLFLTAEQMKTIVDASYVSVLWETEIASMDTEYHSVYEWFKADTAWLRAYLYVFSVQDVSSDFEQQKEIVLYAFDQIFREMDFKAYTTRKDMLWALNNRYLANFDDVTFMIAYRFLQAEGHHYDIGNSTILKAEEQTDILARKYSDV